MPEPQRSWHAVTSEEAARLLDVDPRQGLSQRRAVKLAERFGPNELPKPERVPEWRKFIGQFANPLVGLLLVAAVIATVMAVLQASPEDPLVHHLSDPIAILLIVIVNAVLGYMQERKAEKALDALAKMTAPSATVMRDGVATQLPAVALVPGDVVVLSTGDRVPADVRLVEVVDLALDEALLTGESTSVSKDSSMLLGEETDLADRSNMAFMGTTIARGRGLGLVVATGAATQVGRIGQMLGATPVQRTPLEHRLDRFGRGILVVTLAISILVFLVGLLRGNADIPTLFLVAVSLAVAVIPEGLPAISTITLALGMQRMARQGALVRRLPAVETLGCATVICSDKTGTLTCNEMTVRELHVASAVFHVDGEGYRPEGRFLRDGEAIDPEKHELLLAALRCGAVCSTSQLVEEGGGWKVIGDPTEGALLAAAAKAGIPVRLSSEGERISEIPFAAERRMMAVVVREGPGVRVGYVKGSPDLLLERCESLLDREGTVPLDEARRKRVAEELEDMARRALRVLALCRRTLAEDEPDDPPPEDRLELLGLVGMIDPPRPGVREAIEECRRAGVRVVMVTGDHALTAEAISKELGMWDEGDIVLTGADIKTLSPQELAAAASKVRVFARVTAEQKVEIVQAFQGSGGVVAMTGDGVNDAPALKRADIGVAMGRSGTDVAREAADMVLADDNFATIVAAVREGRAIFRNIQKFIFFLCSSNAGLCVAVLVASLLKWPAVLTPLMILWINLVTNGLPALALGVDRPEAGQMREGPRPRTEGLLNARLLSGIVLVGLVMGACALYLFDRSQSDGAGAGTAMGQLAAFMLLGLSPLFHAFNCRSFRWSIASVGPLANRALLGAVAVSALVQLATVVIPPLRPVFRTTGALGLTGWVWVIGLSALVLPLAEVYKAVARIVLRSKAQPQS